MRWWLLTIGLALMMIAPAATATADAGGPNEPSILVHADRGPERLEPGGSPGTWNLTIEYYAAVPTPEEVTLHLWISEPADHWSTDISPEEITFRPVQQMESPTERRVQLHAIAHVAAGLQAPAFHPDAIDIEVRSEATALASSAEGETRLTAMAGFRPGLAVEPTEQTVTVSEDDAVHLRPTLENLANGPIRVTYGAIAAPSGCDVDPIHDRKEIPRAGELEAVFHLACDDGASGGELAVTYEQAYAPDTSIEGPPVTQTWDVEIDRSTAAQTQAALVGTSASVGRVPVAAWAAVLVAALAGGVRWARER